MTASFRLFSILATVFASVWCASAQTIGPPAPITAKPKCEQPREGSEEVVVCGRNEENSPYRVPRAFRNLETHDDADASHAARQADMAAVERYGSQNVGPAGYLQRSREIDCQWRVAQQERRGERPDCNRQVNRIGPIGREKEEPRRR